MKVLFFSDLHLGTGFIKTSEGSVDRLEIGLDILDQVLKLAQELGALVVFGGDFFDSPIMVPIKAMIRAINLMNSYPGVPVYAISGNHDLAAKALDPDNYPETSLDVIAESVSQFKLMNKTEGPVFLDNGYAINFIPFFDNKEAFSKAFERIMSHENLMGEKSLLVIHQTPEGNLLNLPSDFEADLSSFHRVFCGHIHKPGFHKNVLVMGNPYHRDAGDRGQEKFVYVLDTKVEELAAISLKYPEIVSPALESFTPSDETVSLEFDGDVIELGGDFLPILEANSPTPDHFDFIKTLII